MTFQGADTRRLAYLVVGGALAVLLSPTQAQAQRFPFEQSIKTSEPITLDVTTIRGKIEVSAGAPGLAIVRGAATVRPGWNVPSDAVDLAREFARSFRTEVSGGTIRLQPPAEGPARDAMTVNYAVIVPPDTKVLTVSDSGETTVAQIAAAVRVKTQSGAISLKALGGTAEVSTGSGDVQIDGVKGNLTVSTSSSAISARQLGDNLRVRTGSGQVTVGMSGSGSVDVQTESSAIEIAGLRGALVTRTGSGHTRVEGAPTGTWDINSGSGSTEVTVPAAAGFDLDATTGSGSVVLRKVAVTGNISKRAAKGAVHGGGPAVKIDSRSGSITVAAR